MAIAILGKAGITAQRLRFLDLLLKSPWNVTLPADWGFASAQELQIPNPVSFIVQKLLIHDRRLPAKQTQELLYIHDTLELFAPKLEELAARWRDDVRNGLSSKWVQAILGCKDSLFGQLNDRVRDAAAIPQDRKLVALGRFRCAAAKLISAFGCRCTARRLRARLGSANRHAS